MSLTSDDSLHFAESREVTGMETHDVGSAHGGRDAGGRDAGDRDAGSRVASPGSRHASDDQLAAELALDETREPTLANVDDNDGQRTGDVESDQEYLRETARSLTLARIRNARGLLRAVNEIGASVDELQRVQDAINSIRAIHVSLKASAVEELRRAASAVIRHNFDVQEPDVLLPFSACVDKVVEMFMVDLPRVDE